MSFSLALDERLQILFLLVLHDVKDLLRMASQLGLRLIGVDDVALQAVDELVQVARGALVVLVASGHVEHVLGEFVGLRLVVPVSDALVHLDPLLLMQAVGLGLRGLGLGRGLVLLPLLKFLIFRGLRFLLAV